MGSKHGGESAAIETVGLLRSFGDLVAVDGVNLSIADGERFRCSSRTSFSCATPHSAPSSTADAPDRTRPANNRSESGSSAEYGTTTNSEKNGSDVMGSVPVAAQREPITPAEPTSSIVLFALVVLSAGWIGRLLDEVTGAGDDAGIGQFVWIVAPIVTAAVLRYRGEGGWSDAGLRPRLRSNGGWYALSLVFYPLVVGIAVGVGFWLDDFTVDGGGRFPFESFTEAFLIGLVPVSFTSIAEEFGWRGYLVPRLDTVGVGRWINHLVVGLIWGAWHIPYVAVFWDNTDESLATLVPRILVGTVVAAVVYGEIRLATGSVWPAVVMHAMGNAFAGALLAGDVLNISSATPIASSPGVDGLIVIGLTATGAAIVAAVARRRWTR